MGDGTDLNNAVLNFGLARVRQQVGTGWCWDFAEEAITKNGGVSSRDLTQVKKGESFEKADYVWGDEVDLANARPGDILQFKDHVSHVKMTKPDGSWEEWDEHRPQHTAILVEKKGNGRLTILEQHVTVRRYKETNSQLKLVKKHEIFVQPGTFSIEGWNVNVETSGTVKFYRPKASSTSPP